MKLYIVFIMPLHLNLFSNSSYFVTFFNINILLQMVPNIIPYLLRINLYFLNLIILYKNRVGGR